MERSSPAEKIRYKLLYAYLELESVFLYPIQVDLNSGFCRCSSFSKLDARFDYCTDDTGHRPAYRITSLLTPEDELEVEKYLDVLEVVVSSGKKPWPPADKDCKLIDFSTCTEQEVFLEVCTNILCPISTTVKLERNYAHAVETLPDRNLLCGNTGIGDSRLWHGFPDALVNCTLTICSPKQMGSEEFEYQLEASDSDDEETVSVATVEAKRKLPGPLVIQFIAKCVINSFIDKNTTGEGRLQPAVLINGFYFRICFYDCTRDILLLSTKINLSMKGTVSMSSVFLLWLIFNHRYVYKMLNSHYFILNIWLFVCIEFLSTTSQISRSLKLKSMKDSENLDLKCWLQSHKETYHVSLDVVSFLGITSLRT